MKIFMCCKNVSKRMIKVVMERFARRFKLHFMMGGVSEKMAMCDNA